MKKLTIRIAGAVVLLLILGVVILFFSLNSIVKKGFNTFAPKLTQVDTRLKAANISPLSGSGELTGLFIGNPQGFKTPFAIQVGDMKMGLKVSSLLSDTIVINEVTVKAPEITYETSLNGSNLSKILDNLNAAVGGGEKTEKTEKQPGKKFAIKDVLVEGGKIHLNVGITQSTGGVGATVPLPTVHLQNIGTPEKGVTAAEMSAVILKSLLAEAVKASGESVSALGKDAKDIGKGAAEKVGDAAKGLKGLFK